ncbi:hypothetical protein [Arabidopsis thaliana]|uniref:Uncharacterized protein AT4g26960 n=1 Tax=Arabidopsis thaliana TaxID=3702 RepID=Q9SZ35_ARATH|nr:hypothetical protein [Arabidopsis thaliana]CAB79551.1 hypothetical protein [Arabidopsis thaliana]
MNCSPIESAPSGSKRIRPGNGSLTILFYTMKGISRSPVRRNDGFHRYMKPGALAQIRNARINNARSNFPLTRSLSDPVDPPSSSSESPIAATPQTITMDQMPHLLSKIYGPYRIAARYVSENGDEDSRLNRKMRVRSDNIIGKQDFQEDDVWDVLQSSSKIFKKIKAVKNS